MSAAYWTPARVETLERLWRDGKSAAEIAKLLGGEISRNAVVGKAHRMKLGNHLSGNAAATPGRRSSAPTPKAALRPAQIGPVIRTELPIIALALLEPPVNVPGVRGLRIADEGFSGCRWPLLRPLEAADANTRFCCAPAHGRTFCPVHAVRAYPGGFTTVRQSAKELIRGLRRYTS